MNNTNMNSDFIFTNAIPKTVMISGIIVSFLILFCYLIVLISVIKITIQGIQNAKNPRRIPKKSNIEATISKHAPAFTNKISPIIEFKPNESNTQTNATQKHARDSIDNSSNNKPTILVKNNESNSISNINNIPQKTSQQFTPTSNTFSVVKDDKSQNKKANVSHKILINNETKNNNNSSNNDNDNDQSIGGVTFKADKKIMTYLGLTIIMIIFGMIHACLVLFMGNSIVSPMQWFNNIMFCQFGSAFLLFASVTQKSCLYLFFTFRLQFSFANTIYGMFMLFFYFFIIFTYTQGIIKNKKRKNLALYLCVIQTDTCAALFFFVCFVVFFFACVGARSV